MSQVRGVGDAIGYGIVTWSWVATIRPEFVAWIVATHGPLPEGNVKHDDYERYRAEYEGSLVVEQPMLRSPDAIVFGPDRPIRSIIDRVCADEDDGEQD